MEFGKTPNMIQIIVFIASLYNAILPMLSTVWQQLLVKYESLQQSSVSWENVMSIVVLLFLGIYLNRLFRWTKGKTTPEKSKDEHLLNRVQTIETRLNASDTKVNAIDLRLDTLKDRTTSFIDTLKDRIDKIQSEVGKLKKD